MAEQEYPDSPAVIGQGFVVRGDEPVQTITYQQYADAMAGRTPPLVGRFMVEGKPDAILTGIIAPIASERVDWAKYMSDDDGVQQIATLREREA